MPLWTTTLAGPPFKEVPVRLPPMLIVGLLSVQCATASGESAAPQSTRAPDSPPACWQPDAARVLVAFASDSGHTAALAREVGAGAATVAGACVWTVDVADVAPAVVLGADAIVVGSPVHNANPAARLLAWIERWPFKGAPLRDKVGAAFVTAGGISAGEEVTQLALLHAMLEFGMVVVGGADWQAAFGASAIVGEPPFDAAQHVDRGAAASVDTPFSAHFNDKARGLGARVATLASRLRGARQADASAPVHAR